MKLAEALQERADLTRRIEELRTRIANNVLVQDGEKPAENPSDLLKELDSCMQRMEELITSINITNARTKVNGTTLTELIARKDVLQLKISAYRDAVHQASLSTSRARGTEIKVKPLLKAADLQKQIDLMSKELRETDNLLQETNWKTELK